MRISLLTTLIYLTVSLLVPQTICSQTTKAKPIQDRLQDRDFPSIFMAWNQADNLSKLSRLENIAKHDLAFLSMGALGLKWDHKYPGLATNFTKESVKHAQQIYNQLHELNPNLIILLEIRYRDAWSHFLPPDHKWWKRDDSGKRIKGWEEGNYYLLDYENLSYQEHVAIRAFRAIQSKAVDGIMLDWWKDDLYRQSLIKNIRRKIGKFELVLVNSNDRKIPMTAEFINGLFMECYRSNNPENWPRIANTLVWAEKNLRKPTINCLETWNYSSSEERSRMRATTCLSLVHSDGFCLFSDPNDLPTPDHLHEWYSFWNQSLGHPIEERKQPFSTFAMREYENGTVIYNPPQGKTETITFPTPYKSVTTGKYSKTHTIQAWDGDIFLKIE